MAGIGFAGGGDFVDNVFNRYRDKVSSTADPAREYKNVLSQVDKNVSDYTRNINAQKRRASMQLSQADFYGGLGDQAQGALNYGQAQSANRSAMAWEAASSLGGAAAEYGYGQYYGNKLDDPYSFGDTDYGRDFGPLDNSYEGDYDFNSAWFPGEGR